MPDFKVCWKRSLSNVFLHEGKMKSLGSHNFTALRPCSHLYLLSFLFLWKKGPLFCCLGAEGR